MTDFYNMVYLKLVYVWQIFQTLGKQMEELRFNTIYYVRKGRGLRGFKECKILGIMDFYYRITYNVNDNIRKRHNSTDHLE